jgi:hypothetical protein
MSVEFVLEIRGERRVARDGRNLQSPRQGRRWRREITSQQLAILYIFIVSFSDLIIVSYICILYMYLIYVSFICILYMYILYMYLIYVSYCILYMYLIYVSYICILYVSYSDLSQFSQFKTLIFAINGYQSGNSTCFLGGSVSQGFNFCRVSKIFHVLDYAPADRGGNPFWFPQKHNFEIGGFPIAMVISWRISVGNF